MAATKAQVQHAIQAINDVFGCSPCERGASLIDWRDVGDGLAINVEELGFDAVEVSHNATVHGALPKGTFLEPITNVSLRLVIA
jgi:hypothetical protein